MYIITTEVNYWVHMFSADIYKSWQGTQKQKFEGIRKHLGPLEKEIFHKKIILDIGCGNGYLEKFFKGNFVGLDKSMEMLARPEAIFPRVLGNGDALPFKDGCFDAIVAIDSMHLIRKNDFVRVLKNDGLALMSVFHNEKNYHDRKENLLSRLEGMTILDEFEITGRENEYVVIAVKR